MSREFQTISIDKRGAADWVTLNRPYVLNTLNVAMIQELGRYFSDLESDHSVRVVVLRGAGPNFCAGLDLKDMGAVFDSLDAEGIYRFQRALSRIILKMRGCPQPIVACVRGAASGGGFALALACDIRYCTPDARMNAAFIKVGLSGCDVGVSYLLPKLVGTSVASELLLTGQFLAAPRACALGLVASVIEAQDIEAAVERTVEQLLQAAPLALSLTKQGLNANINAAGLEAAIELEDRQQSLLAQSPQFIERVRAFIRKR